MLLDLIVMLSNECPLQHLDTNSGAATSHRYRTSYANGATSESLHGYLVRNDGHDSIVLVERGAAALHAEHVCPVNENHSVAQLDETYLLLGRCI